MIIKKAFLFSCYTGLRISDIIALRWKDIIHNENSLYISYKQTKTTAEELLSLSPIPFKILGKPGRPEYPVFRIPHNSRINRCLKTWAKHAGISKNLFFHMSRHTCGTLLHSFGTDIYTISKILGHSDTRVTQIYAKVIDKVKEEAVLRIPALD